MNMLVWLLSGCQSDWAIADADGDGFTWLQGDCDDANPDIFPSAQEVCDSVDNNCNGEADSDAPEALVWYGDVDGDGFTGEALTQVSCEIPAGYTASPTDCDDGNSAINPDAVEYCNDIDDNCNGSVDEDGAVGGTIWYADIDGDGYGNPDNAIAQCVQNGTVSNSDDCDDTRDSIHPDASEVCDGSDNDCDDLIDDADPDVNASKTWYADDDEDGYGDVNAALAACEAPSGYVESRQDCDDTDVTIYPGSMRIEVPRDGIDVDCDNRDYCVDLSCDGRPDVILPLWVNDDDSHELSSPIYLSMGLTASLSIDTIGPLGGTTSDLNSDGYLEVILATGRDDGGCESSSVIYWGDESLTIDGTTELPTGGARDVLVEDLNADGRKDIVFTGSTDLCETGESAWPALIYWGTPMGYTAGNATNTTAYDSWRVDAGDIDLDGEMDLLLCRHLDDGSYSAGSLILWGDSGDFSTATELATEGCADQLLEDLDGDGLLDVVFANYRSDTGFDVGSSIYWNDGQRFDIATVEALDTIAAWSVQSADLNGDGLADLVFGALADATDEDNPLWELDTLIFWNDGTGFGTTTAIPTPGSPFPAVADLDGDGLMEVVVAGYRTDDAFPIDRVIDSHIYWGADDYSESGRTDLETNGAWQASVADFDEDDHPGQPRLLGLIDGVQ